MTKDEALKLALDALEYADACLKKQLTTKTKHEYAQDLLLGAGTAIKEALAHPAQEPEPDELTIAYMSGLLDGKKQRPWVGLTDEHIIEIYTKWESTKGTSWADLMRAVEAKLKEKNT